MLLAPEPDSANAQFVGTTDEVPEVARLLKSSIADVNTAVLIGVPPVTVMSIAPFDPPLQLTFVCVSVILIGVGCGINPLVTALQPLPSVTV